MYKIGNDPAGWLTVSPETGVIKVRTRMDKESAYVKNGKYKAIILAVDDDATCAGYEVWCTGWNNNTVHASA